MKFGPDQRHPNFKALRRTDHHEFLLAKNERVVLSQKFLEALHGDPLFRLWRQQVQDYAFEDL